MSALTIRDHDAPPRPTPPSLAEWFEPMLVDRRDVAVVHSVLRAMWVLPAAVVLFAAPSPWVWALGAVYAYLLVPFIGEQAIVSHLLSHRRLFKREWKVLNLVVPWGTVFFYGITPGGYMAHHVGMHHPEENVGPDRSSTMYYQRDSPWDFALYNLRFVVYGKADLAVYLWQTNKRKLLKRLGKGELLHKSVILAALWLNWQAALLVFVIPFVLLRWGLMMGNWTEHAFIDPSDPGDPYKNSVTMVNCPYNIEKFNDGYHTTHHIKQMCHWAELPGQFQKDLGEYERTNSVVFDGIRGVQALWVLLMRHDYDTLAKHLVSIGDIPTDHDEKVAWLRGRTAALPRAS